MTEAHLEECLKRLDDTRALLDRIQTDLRGAQEFRDAVFDMLEGTPFGEQLDSTYDGLFGRLQAALTATALAAARVPPPSAETPQGWQPIETAPKDHEGPRILVWAGEVHLASRGFTVELPRAGWFNERGWLIHPTHWMPLPTAPSLAPPYRV